jgi:ribosomal protein L27
LKQSTVRRRGLRVRPGRDVVNDHTCFANAGGEFDRERKRAAFCIELAVN